MALKTEYHLVHQSDGFHRIPGCSIHRQMLVQCHRHCNRYPSVTSDGVFVQTPSAFSCTICSSIYGYPFVMEKNVATLGHANLICSLLSSTF